MSFQGKVVLVTGGSAGIGAATAIAFAKERASVVIVGRDDSKLTRVADDCRKFGQSPLAVRADVTKDDDVKVIIDKVVARYGKLDVLVNNAGILRDSAVDAANAVSVYDEVMETNVRAAVMLTNFAVPLLAKSKGSVVIISSVAAEYTLANHSAYCMSKAALNQYTKIAASELAAKGVRVNAVSPGPVKTDLFSSANSQFSWDALKAITAQNRLSKPEEIARVVMFLASDLSESITGSNYVIDCGLLVK